MSFFGGVADRVAYFARWNNSGTIARSKNVSGVTLNATGIWTITISPALPSANHVPIGMTSNTDGGGSAVAMIISETTVPTTSAVKVVTCVGTGGNSTRVINSIMGLY